MKKNIRFKELGLPGPLLKALETMNFIQPTSVQAASLPPALSGKDVLGTAQTGTGKTGAFAIPLITKLLKNPGMKAVILAPTRELAVQIQMVMAQMTTNTKLKGVVLVGGESFFDQKLEVKSGADYFIATPGRLIDHLDAGLKLTKVGILVLDEVDRMLDMGFAPQLEQIVPQLPESRQTLFFSATLPKEAQAMAAKYLLEDAVRVSIGTTTQPIEIVKQENHPTTHLQKNELMLKHLDEYEGRILIFARTQHRANKVYHVLERNRIRAVLLHGGRTQNQRKNAMNDFRAGTHPVMVATDLAGRGIDVDDISCVINYDLAMNREDYIHRIGRTGRNGKAGTALNYLVPEDKGGVGIVSAHPSKAVVSKLTPKPKKHGWEKGGWERSGGRRKPEYHKRAASEGYGKAGQDFEKKLKKKTGVAVPAPKVRRPGDTRAKDAARKLGLEIPKKKIPSSGIVKMKGKAKPKAFLGPRKAQSNPTASGMPRKPPGKPAFSGKPRKPGSR